ncbi:MAG: asparagine synthase (glutamine-hydrolyzing) [Dethiobacteria bacterium]
MGGICGILLDNNSPVSPSLITLMCDQMLHRGPDEGGYYIDRQIGLGFRRLKVIDPLKGKQPMSNEDGSLWLICNGEIYNYLDLRQELVNKGHTLKTDSDVEVILHLYEDKGKDCLHFLRGMFAFVLYDQKKKLLFGARDRFGIKPFFYVENPGRFAFASEIKALLALQDLSASVDEGALFDYLTFQYVPEPKTMFSGIYRLPPAHYFQKPFGKPMEISRYWQLTFSPVSRPLEYFVEGIRERMQEAVHLHLAGDLPLGAFLSSGIDSSIIAALVREQQQLSTFSVGYAEEDYSELREARKTAEYLGTDHHEYIITPEEFLKVLPHLIWHFDEPVADPAAISLFFVARLAREKVNIALSGEGADEVFAGYSIYREPFSLAPLRNLPQPLQNTVSRIEKMLPTGVFGKNYLQRAGRPLEKRFLGNANIFSLSEKKFFTNIKVDSSPFRVTDPLYRKVAHLDEVSRMQYIDLHTWMPGDILVKADRMSMANSLALRVPFLDHRVVEFATTLPLEFKIHGKTTKRALREAFKDLLPPAAVHRPKWGFPVPLREWIKRNDYRSLILELLESKGGEWFNKTAVKKLLADHLDNRVNAARKLWTILIFLLWHEIFLTKNGEGKYRKIAMAQK